MKRNYKLTPQIYKQLVTLAKGLAPFVKVDSTGKVLYKNVTDLKSSQIEGDKIRNTFERKQVPMQVNHEVNLIEAYKRKGHDGVQKYIDELNRIVKEQKENEETNSSAKN